MKFTEFKGIRVPTDDPAWVADLMLQRTGGLFALQDPDLRERAGRALSSWWDRGDRAPLEALCEEREMVDECLPVVIGEAQAEADELLRLAPKVTMRRLCSVGPGNGLVELFLMKRGG